MSVAILENFAKSPAPGFRCFAAGDETGPRFLAKIRHVLNPPASSESISLIRRLLADHAENFVAFYQRHDGFMLYLDTLSDAAGILLLPAQNWAEATQEMREWFGHLAGEAEADPDYILTGVAIATVPRSGNYFVVPVEGPNAGKIFYADHDGWYESAFANDMDDFLLHATRDPVKLLVNEVGCYTRYSDGETDAQWIPEIYFPDISTMRF